jgi:hypothetical protein
MYYFGKTGLRPVRVDKIANGFVTGFGDFFGEGGFVTDVGIFWEVVDL